MGGQEGRIWADKERRHDRVVLMSAQSQGGQIDTMIDAAGWLSRAALTTA